MNKYRLGRGFHSLPRPSSTREMDGQSRDHSSSCPEPREQNILNSYSPQRVYNLIPSQFSTFNSSGKSAHILGVARDSRETYALVQSNGGAQFYYQGSNRVNLPSERTTIYLLRLFPDHKPDVQKLFDLPISYQGELDHTSLNLGEKMIGATYNFFDQDNQGSIHHLALINRDQISDFTLIPTEGTEEAELFPIGDEVYLAGSGSSEIKIGESLQTSSGGTDLILAKFNSKQQLDWVFRSKSISDQAFVHYRGGGLAPNQNLLVTGSFFVEVELATNHSGSTQNERMFWGEINPQGEWVRSNTLGLMTEPGPSNDQISFTNPHVRGHDVVGDQDDVHLVGSFRGKLNSELSSNQVTYFYLRAGGTPNKIQLVRSDLSFDSKIRVEMIGPQVVIGVHFDTMIRLNTILYRNKGNTALILITPDERIIRHLDTNGIVTRKAIFSGDSLDSIVMGGNLLLYQSRVHGFIVE